MCSASTGHAGPHGEVPGLPTSRGNKERVWTEVFPVVSARLEGLEFGNLRIFSMF